MVKILVVFMLLSLLGCSSRPKLYPNDKLQAVGKQVAKKDIDQCLAENGYQVLGCN